MGQGLIRSQLGPGTSLIIMLSNEYQLWRDIEDQIGPAGAWPRNIRRLFWEKNVVHWQRIILATFVYVNGLNPVVFMEWATLRGMCRDAAARRHFVALFRIFDGNPSRYNLWAWNMAMSEYQYLDGRRRYGPLYRNR